MSEQSVITSLEEEIYKWLDEAWDEYCGGDDSEFLLGKIYAYVECLEILLHSEGIADETLIELESRYGIR